MITKNDDHVFLPIFDLLPLRSILFFFSFFITFKILFLQNLKKLLTYVISGEQEIQKQNNLLSLSNIHPVLFNADWITNLFRMFFKSLYPQQILSTLSKHEGKWSTRRICVHYVIKSQCAYSNKVIPIENPVDLFWRTAFYENLVVVKTCRLVL